MNNIQQAIENFKNDELNNKQIIHYGSPVVVAIQGNYCVQHWQDKLINQGYLEYSCGTIATLVEVL